VRGGGMCLATSGEVGASKCKSLCMHEMLQSGASSRADCQGSLELTLSSLQLQSSSVLECGYSFHVLTSPSQELTLLLPIRTTTNHMNIPTVHKYVRTFM